MQDNQFAMDTKIEASVFQKMTELSDELHLNYPPDRISIFKP